MHKILSKTSPSYFMLIASLSSLPLILIALTHTFYSIPVPLITRDITSIANIHPLSGALSSLGILLWIASASIWGFTFFVVRNKNKNKNGTGLFFYSGILSAYLGFDDLFLFHEYLAPTYLHIPEKLVFVFLGTCIANYIFRYFNELAKPDGLLLIFSLMFLTGSAVCDIALSSLHIINEDLLFFMEDGLKWIGICCWTSFCLSRCFKEIVK